MTTTSSPLRSALRSALQSKALTLTQLGKLSGLDRTTLSRFLNGKTDLKTENLGRILEALEIDLPGTIDTAQRKGQKMLWQAFRALRPIQRKTFLKVLCQTLRHDPHTPGAADTLSSDLEKWWRQIRLMEGM